MHRSIRKANRTAWSDAQERQLMNGHEPNFDGPSWAYPFSAETLADMARCWQRHGVRIMAEHVHEQPCSRPWAWWKFTCPIPRDMSIPEREQLQQLGVLAPQEIAAADAQLEDDAIMEIAE